MTEILDPATQADGPNGTTRLSLSTQAARNLATTTKSVPQMQEISSRWLLKLLPWVQTAGGVYRVNRRLSYAVGSGRVSFANTGADVRVIAPSLAELPLLRGFADQTTLAAVADRLVQRDYDAGDVIAQAGHPIDEGILIAHGKVDLLGAGKYGDQTVLGVLADGDYLGEQLLGESAGRWEYTVRAGTPCTVLAMPQQALREIMDQSAPLRAHVRTLLDVGHIPTNNDGEALIDLSAGHSGEPDLPGTYVDYELAPREYELSVAQTVLRIHSRVADLYNEPMNQLDQQVRLTVEALRERQEDELINNRGFGLLHNASLSQRIQTRSGPPTPDDLDELLAAVWKKPGFFLAHPQAIAAFGRECSRRGVYPQSVNIGGHALPSWRGIPIYPCGKLPVTRSRTSSILLLRVGEEDQGVVGLHQTGIPDEYQPSLSVRFMNVSEKGILSYLISAYYSVAVLVPDALAVLENVEIGRTD